MLNFRKLRQDFSSSILRQGKSLYEKKMVTTAKILHFDTDTLRLSGSISGNFSNNYESEIEICRDDSTTIDSNCDCPYSYDCQHLAALLFHLEDHLDHILVSYSKETGLEETESLDQAKQEIKIAVEEAKNKESHRKSEIYEKELLKEYVEASHLLSASPYFFINQSEVQVENAELCILFHTPDNPQNVVLQLALRLPFRSKPLNVPNVRAFLNAMRFQESILIAGKRYRFQYGSFASEQAEMIKMIIDHIGSQTIETDVNSKVIPFGKIVFGDLLYKAYLIALAEITKYGKKDDDSVLVMPSLYCGNLETPLLFSLNKASLHFKIESMQVPAPKLFLQPSIYLDAECQKIEEVLFFAGTKPGVIHKNTYFAFPDNLKRVHLRDLTKLANMVIPEPLFGSFVENALPEMLRYATVDNQKELNQFVTYPFTDELKALCKISYVDGELDASLEFIYDDIRVPVAPKDLTGKHLASFVTDKGILSRNLIEEREIMEALFQGFVFNPKLGAFVAKSEKAIVEFMTSIIPEYQGKIEFDCPQNLLNQFIYDETSFELKFSESDMIDQFQLELKVLGHLQNIELDLLWECCSAKKNFVELKEDYSKNTKKNTSGIHKILVLDLEKLTPIIQFFDEIGLTRIENHTLKRPLWALATLHATQFKDLPIKVTMTPKIKEVQKQILGNVNFTASPIPPEIKANLRTYQVEGVNWLERLRVMHLNGILADDMGLGKTLQAIVALTQFYQSTRANTLSLIVCPTSLLYNWFEEFQRFNPNLKILVVDGVPNQRKKILQSIKKYQILITSYSLLQKDVECYKKHKLGYVILDEAQHIKNRSTRNAQSVKMLQSTHKLILTGTPIENSLLELWSLFDFLMPGLLSSYKRFVEKYLRDSGHANKENLTQLKQKASPFILRRMKVDVLDDLPPVSQIVYHCQLTPSQNKLYTNYINTAREELSTLVQKEGFEKVQIHVLATLTRLKQICCHPAIFAKENPEEGDSAKYDMLKELLNTLIEGKHKIVIFSQYTRMLKIMRKDLEQQGIRLSYLDGSTKNRLEVVKDFNKDASISVFLVSLKAGGSGLNLVGADTVIHYDMWWNPAVENQATDRVHRIGQKKSVMSYKLVTVGTIEEKIIKMQDKKRGLVKKVICTDDEAMSKLTWEEVLELLQV
ncbi:MAG: RNA polymerase-associated protein RapA [Chlamydiae bacterium]|nr:RNA polymerase-associated protein RapA [Chlamydiota bacterium]